MQLISLVLSLAGAAGGAAEIYGDVRLGDAYVQGAPVAVKCGETVASGTTDKSGSFRLSIAAEGKCTFSITHQKAVVSAEVIVFDKPARYRFVLEPKDGGFVLRRV